MAQLGVDVGHAAQTLRHRAACCDQGTAAVDRPRQRPLLLGGRHVRVQLGVLAGDIAGDHLGVDAIGLASPAHALGIAAQDAGVDHEHLQPGGVGQLGQQLVIAAGGFDPQAAATGHAAQPRRRPWRSLPMRCGANECSAQAMTMKRLSTSAPKFRMVCMVSPLRCKLEPSGWRPTALACVQIGGHSPVPLDSSSTLVRWVGDFSTGLSVSTTADAQRRPSTPALPHYRRKHQDNYTSAAKPGAIVTMAARPGFRCAQRRATRHRRWRRSRP